MEDNIYDYSECDEVADNMIDEYPGTLIRRMSFDEALTEVNKLMPDETMTIRSNVAERLMLRSHDKFPL